MIHSKYLYITREGNEEKGTKSQMEYSKVADSYQQGH